MEDLIKLIEIAKKKGQRSIQLVNQNFRKKEISKDNVLYEGIINGKYESDEGAAKAMFKADPGNRNYRNARIKLKQRLLNHLYFLDYEKKSYTAYSKAKYDCLHELHQCQILMMEGANEIAVRMLPSLIKVANEFELVEVSVEATKLLRDEYAKIGKTTPFTELNEDLKRLNAFKTVVDHCEELFNEILVSINKSLSSQQRIIDQVPFQIEEIEDFAKKHKSDRLMVMALNLRLLYAELMWDFPQMIKLCDQIEKLYLNRHNHSVTVNFNKKEIAKKKLYAYYCSGNHQIGGKYADAYLKIFKSGSVEWFDFVEYHFLLMMKGEKFREAGSVFRRVRTHKNFNDLDEVRKNRWMIYRAYVVFVNDHKLLKWGFDIDAFLVSTPNYGKEYVGFDVATLVIQFLYLLREGLVDEVRKRIEALQQYKSVHLDKRTNYRNSIFIRLLSIIEEKDFNVELIEAKGQNYHRKLKRTLIPNDLENDLEVIPFEILWDYAISILKTNKVYVHYRFYHV